MKHGQAVEEVLQAVEDVLVEAGYDDLAVATDRGVFQWGGHVRICPYGERKSARGRIGALIVPYGGPLPIRALCRGSGGRPGPRTVAAAPYVSMYLIIRSEDIRSVRTALPFSVAR